MGSFDRLSTVTASTQRMGAVADGLSGDLTAVETDFKCTPLDPVSSGGRVSLGGTIKTPVFDVFTELLMTMVEDGLDILEGDILTTGGIDYKIRAVGQWNWRPTRLDTSVLILEEVK